MKFIKIFDHLINLDHVARIAVEPDRLDSKDMFTLSFYFHNGARFKMWFESQKIAVHVREVVSGAISEIIDLNDLLPKTEEEYDT